MTTMPVPKGFFVTSKFGPRAGGYHWGTDFGRGGGSGGHPVYAMRAGTVQYAGPASGFGRWVTIDHPASVGGGYTVYGHVIPEVRPGQWVEEGQRIARIDPDRRTNGNVAAHLHAEVHRYVWSQPGPDRLDPEVWLRGARWVGDDQPGAAPTPGVIFGVDVSEHQDGLWLGGIRGIDFVIARTTDGTHRDRAYRSHIEDAEKAGLVTASYHYLRAPSEGTSVAQQVAASLEVMGDKRRPVWIDVETDGGTLTVDDIRTCKDLYEKAGVRVIGIYSYAPYWEGRIAGGEPDTQQFGKVWLANYPYEVNRPFREVWDSINKRPFDYPLGNQKPSLWQFSSKALVNGWGSGVDVNAFRGTKDELKALFYGTGSTKKTNPQSKEESDMADFNRPRPSYINPNVSLSANDFLRAVDAATWETRVLAHEIARRLNLDPDKIVSDAIAADRAKN